MRILSTLKRFHTVHTKHCFSKSLWRFDSTLFKQTSKTEIQISVFLRNDEFVHEARFGFWRRWWNRKSVSLLIFCIVSRYWVWWCSVKRRSWRKMSFSLLRILHCQSLECALASQILVFFCHIIALLRTLIKPSACPGEVLLLSVDSQRTVLGASLRL